MNKDDAVKNHSEWETFADRQKSKTTMAKGAGGITHRYNLDADVISKPHWLQLIRIIVLK